jgi:hypothetical protein
VRLPVQKESGVDSCTVASGREQVEKLLDDVRDPDAKQTVLLTTLEIALALVRFDHVARFIANADHGIM